MKFEEVKVTIPKGIKLLHKNEAAAKFQLNATTKSRQILSFLFFLVCVFGGLGYMLFQSFTLTLAYPLWFILTLLLALQIRRVKVVFHVTPEAVTIANKNYDRTKWGGFYHGGSEENMVANTSSSGHTTFKTHVSHRLGFHYGGHPNDMRYWFSQGNISHIVDWMNGCVNDVPMKTS